MSDAESDDGSDVSSDDDSRSNKPRKYIPSWALRANLHPMLDQQFAKGGRDPDEIFGEVETCDLQAIFLENKNRYKKRTSSGLWTKDRATSSEKLAYKRTMHYCGVMAA